MSTPPTEMGQTKRRKVNKEYMSLEKSDKENREPFKPDEGYEFYKKIGDLTIQIKKRDKPASNSSQ